MKIKILFFVVAAGVFFASCSDKEAATKIADMEKAMKAADSTCLAEKTMLMDSIMGMRSTMDSMMAAVNTVSTSTSTKTTTTKTTPVAAPDKKVDIGTKTGETKKGVDIKKKGGATGGN